MAAEKKKEKGGGKKKKGPDMGCFGEGKRCAVVGGAIGGGAFVLCHIWGPYTWR